MGLDSLGAVKNDLLCWTTRITLKRLNRSFTNDTKTILYCDFNNGVSRGPPSGFFMPGIDLFSVSSSALNGVFLMFKSDFCGKKILLTL